MFNVRCSFLFPHPIAEYGRGIDRQTVGVASSHDDRGKMTLLQKDKEKPKPPLRPKMTHPTMFRACVFRPLWLVTSQKVMALPEKSFFFLDSGFRRNDEAYQVNAPQKSFPRKRESRPFTRTMIAENLLEFHRNFTTQITTDPENFSTGSILTLYNQNFLWYIYCFSSHSKHVGSILVLLSTEYVCFTLGEWGVIFWSLGAYFMQIFIRLQRQSH